MTSLMCSSAGAERSAAAAAAAAAAATGCICMHGQIHISAMAMFASDACGWMTRWRDVWTDDLNQLILN